MIKKFYQTDSFKTTIGVAAGIFLYKLIDMRKKILKIKIGLKLKENYTEEQMDEFRKDAANVPSLIAVVVLFLSIISLYTAYLIIDPFEVY